MKIGVHSVGRMKAGPEKELAERYFDRFARIGPSIGLEFAGIAEVPESRARSASGRRREEAEALLARLRDDSALLLLDEHGRHLTSNQFAGLFAEMRDAGRRSLVAAIGGPDGHAKSLRESAAFVVSLGAMTWPHQIVRILLAEQLYRAVTILSGHPYHRN